MSTRNFMPGNWFGCPLGIEKVEISLEILNGWDRSGIKAVADRGGHFATNYTRSFMVAPLKASDLCGGFRETRLNKYRPSP
jgi:hypothetical protein